MQVRDEKGALARLKPLQLTGTRHSPESEFLLSSIDYCRIHAVRVLTCAAGYGMEMPPREEYDVQTTADETENEAGRVDVEGGCLLNNEETLAQCDLRS